MLSLEDFVGLRDAVFSLFEKDDEDNPQNHNLAKASMCGMWGSYFDQEHQYFDDFCEQLGVAVFV